ncbi:uncharacterized protein LOC132758595 [Ruditapes philippinarum]|uniref:uncharacterized protein LOC132758595 n=1 Tax=Ruditapes philippinarum TaxID=129788 RepID=UPI00295BA549|nr:uncharacterized protein LOC132758595 [Ruditapes philippinarum]
MKIFTVIFSRMETRLIERTTGKSHTKVESNGDIDLLPDVNVTTRIQFETSPDILNDVLDMEEEYMNGSRKTQVVDIAGHINTYMKARGKVFSPNVPIAMSELVAATSMLGIEWVKNNDGVLIPVMIKGHNTEFENGDTMFESQRNIVSLTKKAKDNDQRVLSPSRSAPQVAGTPTDEQLWLGKVRPAVGQVIKYSFGGTGQTSQEGSISDVNATNTAIGNQDPKPADLFIYPSTSKQLVPASLNQPYAGDRIAHSQSANNSTAGFEPANHPVTNCPSPYSTHTGPKKGKKKRQKFQPYYKKQRKPNDEDETSDDPT